MKDLAILSLELILLIFASLGKRGQNICSRIHLALVIINSKVIMRELLGPTDLIGAQALCIYEMTEVIVVRKDQNLMPTAFQEVAPSLECLNNG